jgi:putative DNA primase/helicase
MRADGRAGDLGRDEPPASEVSVDESPAGDASGAQGDRAGDAVASLLDGDEQRLRTLAALPLIDYERRRETEAEQLGFRLSVLDALVKSLRAQNDEPDALAGHAICFDEPEPWPDEVEGTELITEIVEAVKRYVRLSYQAALAAALWVIHAHAFDISLISPRLAILSPEKRCGKTTLLHVIGALVPRPLSSENITAAALFRTVEKYRPTLLIDEADTFLKEKEELRGVINSGHRRDGKVIRCAGDDHEARAFSTWCPTVIATIGNLPATIEDRSIIISLKRRRSDEKVERLRAGQNGLLEELRRKITRWVADHKIELAVCDPPVPEMLNDRAADNWRPLLAIADTAGASWPEEARQVAVFMATEIPSDEESWSVMLLADIRAIFRAIFDADGADRITTSKLVDELTARTDRPWPEANRGKNITPAWVARKLRPYNIRSWTIREGKTTSKGYYRRDFEDAFSRYLPEDAVTTSQVEA